jgi:hypothetical protein
MNNNSKLITWVGILLIIVTGLIHFIDAPDGFEEATYKGVLFVLNGVCDVIAASAVAVLLAE